MPGSLFLSRRFRAPSLLSVIAVVPVAGLILGLFSQPFTKGIDRNYDTPPEAAMRNLGQNGAEETLADTHGGSSFR